MALDWLDRTLVPDSEERDKLAAAVAVHTDVEQEHSVVLRCIHIRRDSPKAVHWRIQVAIPGAANHISSVHVAHSYLKETILVTPPLEQRTRVPDFRCDSHVSLASPRPAFFRKNLLQHRREHRKVSPRDRSTHIYWQLEVSQLEVEMRQRW